MPVYGLEAFVRSELMRSATPSTVKCILASAASDFFADDNRPTDDKNRVECELQITDLSKRLSTHALKIARKQILALPDNDN